MSYSDPAERYALIKPFLELYQRRFTVLDLGAFDGAMSFQIARDFPQAVVIAIEQDPIIVERAREENLPNVIVLNHKITSIELAELAECEHFDVVLALNFLHHMGTDFDLKIACRAIYKMSSEQFYQTPHPQDLEACGQDLIHPIYYALIFQGNVLGETTQFDGHMPRPLIRRLSGPYSILTQSGIGSPANCLEAHVTCGAAFKNIRLRHKGEPTKPWVFGFNLANFLYFGGGWPTKERIVELLCEMPLPEQRHGDIVAHNIICDGQKMQLIDGGDDWGVDDRENLAATIQKVEETLA